jgi:hypothetical protein
MGYMRHHAIIVTGHGEVIVKARTKALEIEREVFPRDSRIRIVSPLSEVMVNGYQSFVIYPDGSKEGWDISDYGDAIRSRWLGWTEDQRDNDGCARFHWAEVVFGDEDGPTRVSASSDNLKDKS